MSVRVRRRNRAVLQAGKTVFSFDTVQVHGLGRGLRISQRRAPDIHGDILVPEDYFFEFMEIVVHLAAHIEMGRQVKPAVSSGRIRNR